MSGEVARLIVVVGRPGTGKTTLARALSERLGAMYLRVDAVEAALRRVQGHDPGVAGYAVVHELAEANLRLGRDVVVDAVCPVPEARGSWVVTAAAAGAEVTVLVTHLPDDREHERRVTQRRPDLAGQHVPTWPEVRAARWEPWDRARDGPSTEVDTTSSGAALERALRVLGQT
ncbi:AAA family ATPase [Georgenia halophila]|uniref:AAA family ATPase n=1 Tax=Georgenia halophila TaxID=620889 RepID=A0ABP8L896_9MICO